MAWHYGESGDEADPGNRVAIIGFGTRGRGIARSLLSGGFDVAVYDRAFARWASGPARSASRMRVIEHASIAGAVANSALVVVATPADAAVEVARAAADHLEPGCGYVDATGCAPRAIALVERAVRSVTADVSWLGRDAVVAWARSVACRSAVRPVAVRSVALPASGGRVLRFAAPGRSASTLPQGVAA